MWAPHFPCAFLSFGHHLFPVLFFHSEFPLPPPALQVPLAQLGGVEGVVFEDVLPKPESPEHSLYIGRRRQGGN